MKTTNKKRNKTKRSSRQHEPLVMPPAFESKRGFRMVKRLIFRLITDGETFRVQHKDMIGWSLLEEVIHGCFGACYFYADFQSRENALTELKYHFGNDIKIVNEWRAA